MSLILECHAKIRKFLVLFFPKLNLIIVWFDYNYILFVFTSKCEEQSELIKKLKKELEDLKSQNERLQSQKDTDCKFYIHHKLSTRT